MEFHAVGNRSFAQRLACHLCPIQRDRGFGVAAFLSECRRHSPTFGLFERGEFAFGGRQHLFQRLPFSSHRISLTR